MPASDGPSSRGESSLFLLGHCSVFLVLFVCVICVIFTRACQFLWLMLAGRGLTIHDVFSFDGPARKESRHCFCPRIPFFLILFVLVLCNLKIVGLYAGYLSERLQCSKIVAHVC